MFSSQRCKIAHFCPRATQVQKSFPVHYAQRRETGGGRLAIWRRRQGAADIIGVLTASDRASTGGALESRAPRSPTVIPLVARRTAASFFAGYEL